MFYLEMRRLLPILALALFWLACSDLDDYRTDEDEVFQGLIAGSATGDAGEDSSFIRSGFPSYTKMELTFDPDRVDSSPGVISTSDTVNKTAGHFNSARLEPIKPLSHDPLTYYTFPGGGRLFNYLFSARIADEPRSALVFLSLMEEGDIEVRVIAPAATAEDGRQLDELFGVFRLKRVAAR